jgi:hypothetical protein
MTLYRCALFTLQGPRPGFTPIVAETDSEARHLAMELLRKSPEVDRVECWRNADLVFRLNQHQMRLESAPLYRDL